MADNRKTFSVTFASQNYDAMAAIEVRAVDYDDAVERAKACLHADFNPRVQLVQQTGG